MVEIRQARNTDREAISKIHTTSVQNIDSTVYNEEELTVWEVGASSVSYAIDEDETVFLVAECDGEVVGFIEASFDEPELDKLYIAPRFQRQGIASILSEEIDRLLRSRGINSVYVEASQNAVPFYEQIGYERASTHQKALTVAGVSGEMKVVDMTKELR